MMLFRIGATPNQVLKTVAPMSALDSCHPGTVVNCVISRPIELTFIPPLKLVRDLFLGVSQFVIDTRHPFGYVCKKTHNNC